MSARLLLAILLATLPASLHAQQKLTLDPAHSEVHFTLDGNLHATHGTFNLQSGEIDFDAATGKASGVIAVDALSGQSGDSSRDHRMTNEILNAPAYKAVSFTPTHFAGTFNAAGDSTLNVHGIFTLLGKPHEIDVPMKTTVSGGQLHATGSFVVPYVQWGLKDPSTFVFRVNKEVHIDLALVGTIHH